jgi:hypothetical protein
MVKKVKPTRKTYSKGARKRKIKKIKEEEIKEEQSLTPTTNELTLLDFIDYIYEVLDEHRNMLEHLSELSLSLEELESETRAAAGQIKTLMYDIETLGKD